MLRDDTLHNIPVKLCADCSERPQSLFGVVAILLTLIFGYTLSLRSRVAGVHQVPHQI